MDHMLMEILRSLVASGPDSVSQACSGWLSGKIPRSQLETSIETALSDCETLSGNTVSHLRRALELLSAEPCGFYYGKLVRDRIPDMIRQQGGTPHVRILNTEEYLAELYRKLREETQEYLADENEEEIADILEVIDAICTAKGFSRENILQIKQKKSIARGGFSERIYLISKD